LYKKKQEELHKSGLLATATVLAYSLLYHLWNMPIERYFEIVRAKPTYAQLKGWVGEYLTRKSLLLAKAKTRGKIKVTSNPLNDLNEWLSYTGKGVDFSIKIGRLLIAIENKFAESLTLQNVIRHVEPRFLTNKEGEPLGKVHYKILLLTNDETYICPSVRKYLKRKGILIMTTEELKRFLIELSYDNYRHYGYLKYPSKYSSSNCNCSEIMGFRYGNASFYNLISSNLGFG